MYHAIHFAGVITSATTKQGAARKLHEEILWRCEQLWTLRVSTNFRKDRYVAWISCNNWIAVLNLGVAYSLLSDML